MTGIEWAILGLLFIAVVGVVTAVGAVVGNQSSMRQRLRSLGMTESRFQDTASVDADARTPLQRIAEPMAKIATPTDETEITRFRAKFYNAGIRARAAPVYFFAIKAMLALGLPLLTWLALQLSGGRVNGSLALLIVFVAATIGYYLPNAVLTRLAESRMQRIFEAFPDAIDLMVVCVEAGLSLDMSLQRAAKEMEIRSTELAEELSLVGVELRIGATRERALRNLAARTGVEEIQMFVAMLLQADRFGTSVADSLRVHAEELRLRRQYRAEEAATKIPTKLLFPLMLTIFPAMMLVLVGPAVIGIIRDVVPALSRGMGG